MICSQAGLTIPSRVVIPNPFLANRSGIERDNNPVWAQYYQYGMMVCLESAATGRTFRQVTAGLDFSRPHIEFTFVQHHLQNYSWRAMQDALLRNCGDFISKYFTHWRGPALFQAPRTFEHTMSQGPYPPAVRPLDAHPLGAGQNLALVPVVETPPVNVQAVAAPPAAIQPVPLSAAPSPVVPTPAAAAPTHKRPSKGVRDRAAFKRAKTAQAALQQEIDSLSARLAAVDPQEALRLKALATHQQAKAAPTAQPAAAAQTATDDIGLTDFEMSIGKAEGLM